MVNSTRIVNGQIDKPCIQKLKTAFSHSETRQPVSTTARSLQCAKSKPESMRSADILQLQRTLGNRAVGSLLGRSAQQQSVIQAKLTVNAPGDPYEQEADRVAEQVMRMPTVQREALDEEGDAPQIMTKPLTAAASDSAFETNPEFEQQLNASRGHGEPLPSSLCGEFEGKFGADFSGVRIHADAQADQLNKSIQAKAFTSGQDVFFRQGTYEPGNRRGQMLIAHELTHVVQQVPQRGREDAWLHNVPKKSVATREVSPGQKNTRVRTTRDLGAVQRKFEPAIPQTGHSKTQFGINERIRLSVLPVKAKQYANRLEWRKELGEGKITTTTGDGSAIFTAGDHSGPTILGCYTKGVNQRVDGAMFEIVPPTGGHLAKAAGSQERFLPNAWGISFVGKLYITPDDVDFSGIMFREGACPEIVRGPWDAGLSSNDKQLAPHPDGSWQKIERDAKNNKNMMDGEDWVSSGVKTGRFMGQQSSGYQWQIPWFYQTQGKEERQFVTVNHDVTDDGQGKATLSKGGVKVEHTAGTTGQFFYTNQQSIQMLKQWRPNEITQAMEVEMLNTENVAADLVYAVREQNKQGADLQQEYQDSLAYWKNNP